MQHTFLPPKIYFRSYPTPPFFPVCIHICTFDPSVCHRLLSHRRLSCAQTRSLSYSPALRCSYLVAPVIALSIVEILLPPRLCHHTTAYSCMYVCVYVCVLMSVCTHVCIFDKTALSLLAIVTTHPNTTHTTPRTNTQTQTHPNARARARARAFFPTHSHTLSHTHSHTLTQTCGETITCSLF